MTVRIAPAERNEFPAIAEVWDRSWLSTNPPAPKQNNIGELAAELDDPAWDVRVAWDGGRVAGFVAWDEANEWLAQLFVDPEFQGRGIGVMLFDLVRNAMPQGFAFRADETNRGARRFYDRLGCTFDRIDDGRAYYRWQSGCPGPN